MLSNNRQTAAILAALVAASFVVSLFFLLQSALLPGQDAPYYLRGVESIQRTGFLPGSLLEWPPVFFYTAAFFSVFFETVAGIKVAAALFSALLAFSVFLLAKRLLKSNEAALVAAFFACIAPPAMRLLNGFWKTSTALLFLPLFFYFFLRAGESKKNLLYAIAMLLLVFLAHKFVAMLALLILLAFVVMRLVFEKKLTTDTKNAGIVFALFTLLFCILFLAGRGNLSELISTFGLINAQNSASASASLWQYYSAMIIPAFFGALYCFFYAKRVHLFLLSWFVAGLFVAMPLTSGDNYWRFAFLLSVPFALLASFFFFELKKSLGTLNAAAVFLLVVALILPVFYNSAAQIIPTYSEQELLEIRSLNGFSSGAIVFARGPPLEWLKYYGANASGASENIVLEAKEIALSGKKAFLALDKQRSMLDYSSARLKAVSSSFLPALDTNRFLLARPDLNVVMPSYSAEIPGDSGQYRISNPVLWLFFPAELFNVLSAPFNSLLRALIGLPLSFALIAFILLLLKKKQDSKEFRFAAFVFVAFLILLIAVAK